MSRLGIKVTGTALLSNGSDVPGGATQSLYAVIDIPQSSTTKTIGSWKAGSPAAYLLSSNGYEAGNIPKNDRRLTLLSNEVITGPVHTNDRLDFVWNGNFDIANTSKPENSLLNRNYTISAKKFSPNSWDYNQPMVAGIYHETGDPSDIIVIYGLNFSPVLTHNDVRFPPTNIPAIGVTPEVAAAPYNTTCMKLRVKMPPGVTAGDLYIATTESFAATYYNFDFTNIPNKSPDPVPPSVKSTAPINPPPMKVYGIMQLSEPGMLSDKVYEQPIDYKLALYDSPSTTEPDNTSYVDWTPSGDEPSGSANYSVTYITSKNVPHKKIKVYDKMTFSGDTSKLYYVHSHKAPSTSYYPWTKTHSHLNNIFGMSGVDLLDANKPNDYYVPISGIYDWMTYHRHEISYYLLDQGTDHYFTQRVSPQFPEDDVFFYWKNLLYRPLSPVTAKISPILAPNNANLYTQREYANQVLKLSQGKDLERDVDISGVKYLEPLSTKFNDDRQNGYYDGTTSGNVIDFRSVYFGNDLLYTAGVKAGLPVLASGELSPKVIYVNDKKYSTGTTPNSDYMRVSDTAVNSDYKLYRYIEIPHNGSSVTGDEKNVVDGGVIFVKDAAVWIGGATYKGNVDYSTDHMYGSNIYGNNTIVDGRLSIISYSEQKPTDYTLENNGDIVVVGNVIYKNNIFPYKNEFIDKTFDYGDYNGFRQYQYNHTPIITTTEFNDNSLSWWITSPTGAPILPNANKLNNLGLFASNDIKIPVKHYYQPISKENHYTNLTDESSSDCPCKDELQIHAQLVAGHKLTQANISAGTTSKNDRLIMYGSFYSYYPPDLSYFDGSDPSKPEEEGTGRLYLFDKTLSDTTLAGAPSFPVDSSYSSDKQTIAGLNLPKIVPGTWKQVSD